MFTGIVETMGKLRSVHPQGSGKTFWISAPIAGELKADQSVSHNGVCLTVEEIRNDEFRVTAIHETLQKTNLGDWKPGDFINLERCLLMNGRLDGHIVQGHVDGIGECTGIRILDGSWEYRFSFDPQFAALVIEKGSVCVNGISLTAFNVGKNEFTVAIIPYTYEHTNIGRIKSGHRVNLEFDVVGKYIQRIVSMK